MSELFVPPSQVMVNCWLAPMLTAFNMLVLVAYWVVEVPTSQVIAEEVAVVTFIENEVIVEVALRGLSSAQGVLVALVSDMRIAS